jgi:hypothetical protein
MLMKTVRMSVGTAPIHDKTPQQTLNLLACILLATSPARKVNTHEVFFHLMNQQEHLASILCQTSHILTSTATAVLG